MSAESINYAVYNLIQYIRFQHAGPLLKADQIFLYKWTISKYWGLISVHCCSDVWLITVSTADITTYMYIYTSVPVSIEICTYTCKRLKDLFE